MTRRCSLCDKYHKGGLKAHRQACAVCGGDEQTMGRVEDVNPHYLCGNKELHAKIRAGFGDERLVAQVKTPVVTRGKKPSKAQTSWV